ncbi:MAG TPA: LysR family transcriptional regulator [Streptosporangiaceae bacterium]|nr:LysR family transcriptional regulator [Streptosporangiaceae bacterium]
MELRPLQYAAAVADARSFTRAAAGQVVVQSALSQQVRKLETELGVRLFDRTTRSVTITPAGEALLPIIRRILADVDQLTTEAQAIRGVIRGRLVIGMMEVPPQVLDIAAIISQFHGRHPGVGIALRSGGSDVLVQAVRDRTVDAALVGLAADPTDDRVSAAPLLTEYLVAVLPAHHRLAGARSVTIGDLAAFPFIDFPPGYGLRTETDLAFAGESRQVAFEVTRVEQIIQFIRSDLGVALLPESVARTKAAAGGLAMVLVSDACLRRQVKLVTPANPPGSAAGQAFIATIREFLRALPPDRGSARIPGST